LQVVATGFVTPSPKNEPDSLQTLYIFLISPLRPTCVSAKNALRGTTTTSPQGLSPNPSPPCLKTPPRCARSPQPHPQTRSPFQPRETTPPRLPRTLRPKYRPSQRDQNRSSSPSSKMPDQEVEVALALATALAPLPLGHPAASHRIAGVSIPLPCSRTRYRRPR
jgi:hypothetical protein